MWQGGGQEPRGALGGTSVTSRWPEAREMAKAQSQQGGTLFDISFPNHVVSVLARGGADFSRGCGGVRGLACPPSPGIAPASHGGQFPYEGQSPPPPPAPGPDLAFHGLQKSTQPPASHSANLHAPSGETDHVHLGPGLPWICPPPRWGLALSTEVSRGEDIRAPWVEAQALRSQPRSPSGS